MLKLTPCIPVSQSLLSFGARLDRLVSDPRQLIGRDVFVYRNLHEDVWSVRAENGADKGRVIGHVQRLLLGNTRFRVTESGRQRVLRTGQKNVHAGIRGKILAVGRSVKRSMPQGGLTPISYNPFKSAFFVDVITQKPISAAHKVWMNIDPTQGQTSVQAEGLIYQPEQSATPQSAA